MDKEKVVILDARRNTLSIFTRKNGVSLRDFLSSDWEAVLVGETVLVEAWTEDGLRYTELPAETPLYIDSLSNPVGTADRLTF